MIILSNHGIIQSQQGTVIPESIFVGGNFINYGINVKRFMSSVNLDGSPNYDFDSGYGFNTVLLTADGNNIVEDSAGNFYVAGNFATYKGATAGRIIKLFPDGSVDTSFDVGPTGFGVTPSTIAIDPSGKLYVGGSFTTFQGVTNNRIIRLNTDGSKDAAFDNTTGFGGTVNTIAVDSSGKIYVGGIFTAYKSVTNNRIIRLNPDGSKDTAFDNSTGFGSGSVAGIKLDSSGRIVVIGSFNSYKGVTANGIIRILPTGLIDTTFTTGVGTGFNPISPTSFVFDSTGKIYVGGSNFTTYSGSAYNRIVKINTNGTVDTSFNPGTGFAAGVNSLVIDSSDKIYAGGGFTTYNGVSANRIISLNPNGTINTAFDILGAGIMNGYNDTVSVIRLSSTNKLYVGGSMSTYQGFDVGAIALSLSGSKDPSFDTNGGFFNTATLASDIRAAVKDSAGNIYIAGTFSGYGGIGVGANIIKLFKDGTIDSSFSTGTGFNGQVTGLAIQPSTGKIYACGLFTTYRSTTAQGLIRINLDGQRDPTFDTITGFTGTPEVMVLDSAENLYIGGGFSSYKSTSVTNLIKIRPDASVDFSFNITGTTFNGTVLSIVLDSAGKLYVGGAFSLYRGAANNRIIKLNTDNTKDTSFDNTTGFDATVNAIALNSAGDLYVVGNFTSYKGVSANGIIKINPSGNKDVTFDNTTGFATPGSTVPRGLFIDASGSIYVVGTIFLYKGVASAGIIKLLPTGSIDTTFTPTVAGFNAGGGGSRVILKLT
jgi:uncharacterized delta-60 repeat protein